MEADPGRRERKRNRTLDHLAQTAFRLFEAKGFHTVTMEQIAAEADVAKGTLYNHFPVKEALLAHQFHGELAEGVEKLRDTLRARSTFASRMTHLLFASADWCIGRRDYLPHYFRYRFLNADFANGEVARSPRSGLDRVLESLIGAAQESGELRKDLTSAQLTILFQHLYLAALMRWLSVSGVDLKKEIEATVDVFVNGAGARSKRKKAP
jgi:AcrR family transcriptional regulator